LTLNHTYALIYKLDPQSSTNFDGSALCSLSLIGHVPCAA